MKKIYIIFYKFNTSSIKFISKLLPSNIIYYIFLTNYILSLY